MPESTGMPSNVSNNASVVDENAPVVDFVTPLHSFDGYLSGKLINDLYQHK
jgi:hypothetical protein